MTKAKSGDKVKIHLTGKLDNGKVISSSKNGEPIEIILGKSQIIRGLQEAVLGMEPRQTKTVTVPPEKAFGLHREDLIMEVEKELLPNAVTYEVGKIVELPQTDGKMGKVRVVDVSAPKITLDLNHPFAGKNLVFDITLLEICKPLQNPKEAN
ncbi:MAG: peptidylprolyl isomerase [bacterium]